MVSVLDFLRKVAGEDRVVADRVSLLCYSSDMSPFTYTPDAVVFPKSRDEVVEIVKYANENKVPIIPRGAGTSVTGAILPRRGGVVVDFTKMNSIKEVSDKDLVAVVEPGVILDRFNAELAKYGLFFPPDPGSSPACTIGGMVGTNASGVRAAKYGTTRNWVLGLEVVLANGEVVRTGWPVVKHSAGYDLTQLFIGSEGTLGVVTEVMVKLAPIPPYKVTITMYFDDLGLAGRAVTEMLLSGVRPAAMELMDKVCLSVVNEVFKLGLPSREGFIVMELDGTKRSVEEEMRIAREVANRVGARDFSWTDDPKESLRLWMARKALVPALARVKEGHVLIPLAEDPSFPISEIEGAIRDFQAMGSKYGLITATFGHAADGNLHPVMIIDPADPEQWNKMLKMEEEIYGIAARRRGSLTAEHGIGLAKSPFARRSLGRGLDLMRWVKRSFDPNNIMNPGKLGLDVESRDDPGNLFYAYLSRLRGEFQALKRAYEAIRCFRCGFCRAVCPTFEYYAVESRGARGRVLLSYYFLAGHVEPSEDLMQVYDLCTVCGHCVQACPPGVKIVDIIEQMRRDLATRGFINPTFKALGENVMKHGNIYGLDNSAREELARELRGG
ncbi:MAG: FAD-binding protein [Candidatus Nezhaarchaeota archaeon]|nr:FAD-binding protein [Candidatus Nezhaarchaeota archaeon]